MYEVESQGIILSMTIATLHDAINTARVHAKAAGVEMFVTRRGAPLCRVEPDGTVNYRVRAA